MQIDEHGGNIHKLAQEAGCPPEEILDFSASINPLGPPDWLPLMLQTGTMSVQHYPDPEAKTARTRAANCFGVPAEEIVCGNGSSELLDAALRACSRERAVIPVPAYIDYERSARRAGLNTDVIPLRQQTGFLPDFTAICSALKNGPAAVILGQPNNPTGVTFAPDGLRQAALDFPDSLFIVDEAFADFVPGLDRLHSRRPPNVLTLYSMTKFYSVPGLRVGLAFGPERLIRAIQAILPDWSVNSLAQEFIRRALEDRSFFQKSVQMNAWARDRLKKDLEDLGIGVVPGRANFLLSRLPDGICASELNRFLLREHRMAVRVCSNFTGLDKSYFRTAVRQEEENQRLVCGIRDFLHPGRSRVIKRPARKPQKPALMIQGTCSNAGKSILAAGFCRLLAREGLQPGPFKSQNMSLNSFVTREGLEMGRAQAVQARACGLEPSVDMNPVLLKPGSDTGAQVIVQGRAVDNMQVNAYFAYKQGLWEKIRDSYARVQENADIMVLEGAGSPAEINLKSQDIVNMNLAAWAGARVLIAGDIDRGGVFASFAGTMALLEPEERDLVLGFIINKFRGQKDLLTPALEHCRLHNRKSVLGIVPYIPDLNLPDEDSVSLKTSPQLAFPGREINIGFVDLPHLSNFNDLDPLKMEPDVGLQVVRERRPEHSGLDALVIPGSKNVIRDFWQFTDWGLDGLVQELADRGREVVGICGGFQMLGQSISDPHRIESAASRTPGLGILSMRTSLASEKRLVQISGMDQRFFCPVSGYEIHHGETEHDNVLKPVITGENGLVLGLAHEKLQVWGTYMHGVFDADGFRRKWLDSLRTRKGLRPYSGPRAAYDPEPALDRLADTLQEHTDIRTIFKSLGI
ncbi:MAG: cobyric acid synthase [Desulfonatronovibrionaceae bacterium]